MRAVVILLALLSLTASARAQQEATSVTILRGNGAPLPEVVQQQTVVVQPTTIVNYPYVSADAPYYFFPVLHLVRHRHR
jgi:hypothetical protein